MANTKAAKADREALAGLDADGLTARLLEEKKKLWANNFALGKRQLENTSELAKSRKTIARIHTYQKQLDAKETN